MASRRNNRYLDRLRLARREWKRQDKENGREREDGRRRRTEGLTNERRCRAKYVIKTVAATCPRSFLLSDSGSFIFPSRGHFPRILQSPWRRPLRGDYSRYRLKPSLINAGLSHFRNYTVSARLYAQATRIVTRACTFYHPRECAASARGATFHLARIDSVGREGAHEGFRAITRRMKGTGAWRRACSLAGCHGFPIESEGSSAGSRGFIIVALCGSITFRG